MTLRKRLYLTLEPTERGGILESIFEFLLVSIIILNILAILLDSVAEELTRLKNTLGPSDRHRVDEYLHSVRDVERRIQRAEPRRSTTRRPTSTGRAASPRPMRIMHG